jgi:phage major head subunit gpT-like protein
MPGLQTPQQLKVLFTTLYSQFDNAIQQQGATDLSALVTEVPSTDLYNTYAWLGLIPKWREWIGQRAVQGLKQRAYTIYNKDYECTVGVDRNSFDDARMIDARMVVTNMAKEAVSLVSDLILDLLVNGQSRVAYDGQNFFDTDHPIDMDTVTGSQSNYEASGFALTRANFITARARMRSFVGENGRSMRIARDPAALYLVVPSELEQTAIDIVGVDNIAIAGGTQTNTLKNAAKILVVPELSLYSTTRWYLADSSGALGPFIFQRRQEPRIVLPRPDDPSLLWHKEYPFMGDARFGAGYALWAKTFSGAA